MIRFIWMMILFVLTACSGPTQAKLGEDSGFAAPPRNEEDTNQPPSGGGETNPSTNDIEGDSVGECQDRKDNDGDSATDCDDKDCWEWCDGTTDSAVVDTGTPPTNVHTGDTAPPTPTLPEETGTPVVEPVETADTSVDLPPVLGETGDTAALIETGVPGDSDTVLNTADTADTGNVIADTFDTGFVPVPVGDSGDTAADTGLELVDTANVDTAPALPIETADTGTFIDTADTGVVVIIPVDTSVTDTAGTSDTGETGFMLDTAGDTGPSVVIPVHTGDTAELDTAIVDTGVPAEDTSVTDTAVEPPPVVIDTSDTGDTADSGDTALDTGDSATLIDTSVIDTAQPEPIDVGDVNGDGIVYPDLDHDGYGQLPWPVPVEVADDDPDAGWSDNGLDCDDGNADVNPGMIEVAGNGLDDDCLDGDEALPVDTSVPEDTGSPVVDTGPVTYELCVTISADVGIVGAVATPVVDGIELGTGPLEAPICGEVLEGFDHLFEFTGTWTDDGGAEHLIVDCSTGACERDIAAISIDGVAMQLGSPNCMYYVYGVLEPYYGCSWTE